MNKRVRNFRTLFGLALLGTLAGGCSTTVPASTNMPMQLRVMTYNIHHGEGLDKKVDLERIAGIIKAYDPHLVALQEVDRGTRRTSGVDQPAELGRLTGMQAVFVKNINYQGGEYGNAVLTRLPVESHHNHALPQSRPDEQRGALQVNVRAGDQLIAFIATHFDYHPEDGERLASVELIRTVVGAETAPVILAGDLNCLPDSEVIRRLATFMIEACAPDAGMPFTFPADKPDRRIDFIFHSGSGLRCVETKVIAEAVASDHRPVIASFALSR